MRKQEEVIINGKRLDVILEEHKHWLAEDCDNWSNMRANLAKADLKDVNLSNAVLRGADLSYTKLRFLYDADLVAADLHCADMSSADLRCAKLRYAILYGANLHSAALHEADFYGADLSSADLCDTVLDYCNFSFANLYNADLYNATLYGANLYGANLHFADLNGTALTHANLRNANFVGVKGALIEYRKGKILTEAIRGYKKCDKNVIVTLEIPRGAIVFSINGNVCRTNKAKVIAIDGADRGKSLFYKTSYYVGDEFNIYNFDCEYNDDCTTGIHFFMTREEAEKY